ncbi:MAG TPA: AraC family transcriptional regulator [Pseudoxanthomonas sp.]|nr:AraC family transcriptional regulator [Pseudoxanthomonas sp.]
MDILLPALEIQALFDTVPDAVFFIKDCEGRYTHCNLTLVRRLARKERDEVIGRTVSELFPVLLGGTYQAQDRRVLAGELIDNVLEIHLYPNQLPGWCLTVKRPLRNDGRISGLIGISRDLGQPDNRHSAYKRVQRVVDYMQEHFGETLRVQMLAELAGLSVAQLERHFRRVFQITPQQLLTKLRIEAAMRLLQGNNTIANIGQSCGFADQSAFSRQFKATVGISPRDYRALQASSPQS